MAGYVGIEGADLFAFDNRAALESHILYNNSTSSMTEYDEYVVYRKRRTDTLGGDGQEDTHVPYKVSYDDKEGADVLDNAFRRGRLVDYQVRLTAQYCPSKAAAFMADDHGAPKGVFGVPRAGDLSYDRDLLEGRIRRV